VNRFNTKNQGNEEQQQPKDLKTYQAGFAG
jgi:hypothetical protein